MTPESLIINDEFTTTMNNHLILISRERIIGTEINETSNLIYTEIKIRTKKCDGEYIKNEDYPHLVEKELTLAEIDNFKANKHLYTKVESNENGTIYQYGDDFKKIYWERFPKEPVKEKIKKERTHKVCSKCKKKLPVTDFYMSSKTTLCSACKKCRLNMYKIKNKELSLQKSI